MIEPTIKNTFNIPTATPEVVTAAAGEVEQAYQAALEQAVGISELNADNIDRRRVEGMGASTLVAAETVAAPTPEVYFDPTNTEQLRNVGVGIMHYRAITLKGYDKADFDLAS